MTNFLTKTNKTMGEIADGLINGDFDAETGEWLGEGFGFPRVQRGGKLVPQGCSGGSGSFKNNPLKGVKSYLGNKGFSKSEQREIMVSFCKVGKQVSNIELAGIIQEDFGSFVKYVKSLSKKK